LELRLTRIVSSGVEFRKNRAAELANFVRLLGPQQTLERGYSITLDANGHIIRTMETLEKGDRIQTKLADGVVRSVVDEKVRSEK
jgi:exodeoxyribonuclease VII large subunit